ncbi:membrane protein DedA with SNARE-associated domain [Jatrophihabitans sp. GAS493]|uniref:DedA family protein n=1 Tax=Jatrophihabitans sp. GAS493 TaxID=1907575 RepID=UPI000BB8DFA5|nr:VTT domain-containing protein [Jatrophihabitans sp. GAS493]SOD70496.1 membrane protein DedA with SNARE-associated domain [Jatrophihabitans sp. GAS493]
MNSAFGPGYLIGLFGVVAFGAVVPVLPTGAAVSVAAAVAERDHIPLFFLVILVGAAGAYVGDILTYAALRAAARTISTHGHHDQNRRWWRPRYVPEWARRRLEPEQRTATLARFRRQIDTHEVRTLLLSRLVPGGRIPVLIAASVGGYSLRRFALADLGAALIWALLYATIGLLGRVAFPEPWQAALAAIGLVLLVSLLSSQWARYRMRQADAPAQRSSSPETCR